MSGLHYRAHVLWECLISFLSPTFIAWSTLFHISGMSQVGWSNAVSLILLIAGLTFGSEVTNKSVCEGDSIKLFNSLIQINTSDTLLYLYKNGDEYRDIAVFTRDGNNKINQDNIVMVDNKYLWIINVHITDQGYYMLLYDFRQGDRHNITTYLSVWAAPDTTCKPRITRIENALTARLPDITSCGIPLASVSWKDCSGFTCDDTNIRTLQAGREAGTYYACTTGPALSCARSPDPSWDYCNHFRIDESSDCGKDVLREWLIAIVILGVLVLVVVAIFGVYGWYTHKKLRSTIENEHNVIQELKEELQQQKREQQRKREQKQQQNEERETLLKSQIATKAQKRPSFFSYTRDDVTEVNLNTNGRGPLVCHRGPL